MCRHLCAGLRHHICVLFEAIGATATLNGSVHGGAAWPAPQRLYLAVQPNASPAQVAEALTSSPNKLSSIGSGSPNLLLLRGFFTARRLPHRHGDGDGNQPRRCLRPPSSTPARTPTATPTATNRRHPARRRRHPDTRAHGSADDGASVHQSAHQRQLRPGPHHLGGKLDRRLPLICTGTSCGETDHTAQRKLHVVAAAPIRNGGGSPDGNPAGWAAIPIVVLSTICCRTTTAATTMPVQVISGRLCADAQTLQPVRQRRDGHVVRRTVRHLQLRRADHHACLPR